MKKRITRDLLLKNYNGCRKIVLFSIFVIAGLFCFICPVFYCKEISNLLANMAFVLVIAIPFCGIGIKNIIEVSKRLKQIKQERYSIVEDVVVNKRMLQHGTSKNTSDNYCQLDFEKHSKNW